MCSTSPPDASHVTEVPCVMGGENKTEHVMLLLPRQCVANDVEVIAEVIVLLLMVCSLQQVDGMCYKQ